MSEQDRFDWNDDTELDSTAQGNEDFDDFEDPLDGFADYDDVPDFEDLPEMDAPTSEAMVPENSAGNGQSGEFQDGVDEGNPDEESGPAAMPRNRKRRGFSAVGMGFLYTASILAAGVGVGGAVLLAEGVHPRSLWRPDNLLQFDQLLNFADHPLNILYMVTLGVILLALLGSYKMSRVALEANRRNREAEAMLDRLTALSLDRQDEWQSPEFKEYPPAEAFVIRTLGAWRLQEARQKRLMGVEGELHRLEKALSTNSREDLTGRFDHPSVGRLADEMIRYFDARDLAVAKLAEFEGKDQEDSKEIIEQLQESRKWNGATLDNLNLQCAALDKLAEQMENLALHLETGLGEAGSRDGMTDIIEGIRRDLDGYPAGSAQPGAPLDELNDLVDRGSKLAFKIAMEVARLGPRGERLLPMSQSLEDLTTGFRQLADKANNQNGASGEGQPFRSVHKKLETLAALITEDDQSSWGDMADEVPDFGSAAARISGKLTRLVDEFNEQEDRFVRIGTSLAAMTGAYFDSNSIPRKESPEAPVSPLGIIRSESLDEKGGTGGKSVDMDPFSSSSERLMSDGDQPADPDFTSSALPEMETRPAAPSTSVDSPGPVEAEPSRFNLDGDGTGDMSLSGDEEKVYDLGEFEASPEVGEAESQDDEDVFELSDFGATPAAAEDDPVAGDAPADEDVYELSDLGGVSLESASDPEPDGEEVYELSDFGMTPVTDEDAAPAEEEVYDLSDFSAKPVK